MTSDTKKDTKKSWADASGYDRLMGRWSVLLGDAFLGWLAPEPGLRWLDVGCGTGALTATILRRAAPREILGIDPSEAFVEHARDAVSDERTSFTSGNAMKLDVPDATFDAAVSGLVLNFVPDPEAALREMRRAVCPGGLVAVYVWDYAEGMELLRRFWDAAVELDPGARDRDEGLRFPICAPDRLTETFVQAGLESVTSRGLEVTTEFASFDDYWTPFLTGIGPSGGYCMGLDEAARGRLRDRLEATLPYDDDGRIRMKARAWAVCATVPGDRKNRSFA